MLTCCWYGDQWRAGIDIPQIYKLGDFVLTCKLHSIFYKSFELSFKTGLLRVDFANFDTLIPNITLFFQNKNVEGNFVTPILLPADENFKGNRRESAVSASVAGLRHRQWPHATQKMNMFISPQRVLKRISCYKFQATSYVQAAFKIYVVILCHTRFMFHISRFKTRPMWGRPKKKTLLYAKET